jgi:hypothetical protein
MSHLVNQEGQFGLLQICWVPLLPVVAAVDAPPVAAVVDAALVAGYAAGVEVVVPAPLPVEWWCFCPPPLLPWWELEAPVCWCELDYGLLLPYGC